LIPYRLGLIIPAYLFKTLQLIQLVTRDT